MKTYKKTNLTKMDELLIEQGDYITFTFEINFQNTTLNNLKIDTYILGEYMKQKFTEYINLVRKQQILERSANSDL